MYWTMLVRPPPAPLLRCPSRCAEPSLGWPQHTQSVTYVYQMAEEDGVPVLKTRTQRGGGEWEERDHPREAVGVCERPTRRPCHCRRWARCD